MLYRADIVCSVKNLTLRINGILLKPEFQLMFPNRLNISQLSLSNNYLNTIIVNVYTPFIPRSKLVSLSITNNTIRYIWPRVIAHITSLVSLDLSYNCLQHMNQKQRFCFENIMSTFYKLRSISLVGNSLTNIPKNIFLNNCRLEQILLSNNNISKVTFKIAHLKYLRYLDLRHNRIRVLESSTLSVLQSLFESPLDNITIAPRELNVNKNPLSCCDYKMAQHIQKTCCQV